MSLQSLAQKLPSLPTLDAVDDDQLSGKRPCPLDKFTIADVRALHEALTQPTKVWAFLWCGCVYESDFAVVSLHTTKVGAWRALRKKLWERAVNAREDSLRSGYDFTRLQSEEWRVMPYEIHQD